MQWLKSLFAPSQDTLTAADAHARLKTAHPPFVLDVREPDEFRAGHIEGAMLIPLGELPRRIESLPRDQDILCVCASGSRSKAAARLVKDSGRTVYNLRGGMFGWQRANLPVKSGKSR